MRRIILTIGISFLSVLCFGLCNDENGYYSVGNIGLFNIETAVNSLASQNNCGLVFDTDFYGQTRSLVIGNMYLGNNDISQFMSSDNKTFNCDALVNYIYSNNSVAYTSSGSSLGQSVKDYAGSYPLWSLRIYTELDNFWTSTPKQYGTIFSIKNPASVSVIPTFCSGKKYHFNDIFLSVPNNHVNPSVVFQSGDVFVNDTILLSLTVNNQYNFTYYVTIDGYACRRPYYGHPIYALKTAVFTGVIQDQGLVTSSSGSVFMTSYVFSTGGALEFYGTGLINNGGVFVFDPSIANVGNNVIYVRSNNNGCISDWEDTLFYITPIITNLPYPELNFPATFGPGEDGLWFGQNATGTYTPVGKFHYGCSNRNYTLSVSNTQPGLFFDWKVVYQNYIYTTVTGNSLTISMPDRANVSVDNSSSLYSMPSMFSNNSLTNNGVLVFGYDYDGSGIVDSDESFYSSYMGDQMRVLVRSYNAINDTSNWSVGVIGLVPSPLLENDATLCYSGNPILGAVTSTPIYRSTLNYDSYRSARWDVNNDGVFEFDGGVDNPLLIMTNQSKLNIMSSQIIDSVKVEGWEPVSGNYYEIYHEDVGEVCLSSIDTVLVVRRPELNVTFSDVDTLLYGSPVLSIVSGQYFNTQLDSISWIWSDGSPNYGNDSVWHYFNDLGTYSLDLIVTDQFGCSADTTFSNYWFVPGYLSLEESIDSNVDLYPVPVRDILTIRTNENIEKVEIIDINGKLISEGANKTIDLSKIGSGIYFAIITTTNNKTVKQIVKL